VALVTHATKNVMICDKVVFMARGGNLAYYGPPEEALQYFGVSDFDEIYSRIEAGDAKTWAARFRASRQYQENVETRLAEVAASAAPFGAWGVAAPFGAAPPQGVAGVPVPAPDPWAPAAAAPAAAQVWPAVSPAQATAPLRPAAPRAAAGAPRQRVSTWQQFVVLCQRYLDTIWRDKRTSILLFALAPVLGLLDFIIWRRDVLSLQTGNATRASLMLFMSCIVGILVGTITSVREIVKEDAVYRRERMVGLKVMPYIASKVLIGFVFALYSGIVLFLLKIAAVDFSGLPAASLAQLFLAIMLGTFAGVMWGLLVSAIAPSEDRAMLLVILVLVPQFMFSGAMVPLRDLGWFGKIVGSITSTRWQFGAMVTSAKIESGPRLSPDLSDTFMPGIEKLGNPIAKHSLIASLHDQYGEIFHVNLTLYLGMALLISIVLMIIITVLQKRKDTL
jgi:ABC transport system ATP-binding/permease protein